MPGATLLSILVVLEDLFNVHRARTTRAQYVSKGLSDDTCNMTGNNLGESPHRYHKERLTPFPVSAARESR